MNVRPILAKTVLRVLMDSILFRVLASLAFLALDASSTSTNARPTLVKTAPLASTVSIRSLVNGLFACILF
jgi:hypothetical protein